MASLEYPGLTFAKSVSQNENTTQAIDKLAKTARVISAVTLLHGLSDGSIPVDNAISELMNLGSIDLKSLENFDKTKVDAFMDKLKAANLKDDSKNIENGLRELQTIQQKWKIVGNLNGLPDENTYKKLYALKNVDVSLLKNLPFDNVLDLLAKPSLSEADVGSLKTSLTDISTKIGSTKTSINLEEIIKILESLKPLYIISEVFGLIEKVPGMGKQSAGKDAVDAVYANFKLLNDLKPATDSAMFDAVGKVISSRFAVKPTIRTYSSGFVNGYVDLRKLTDDSMDEWIQKLFGSSVNLDKISDFVQLAEPMTGIDEKWKKQATPDVYNSVERVMRVGKLLLEVGGAIPKNVFEDALNAVDQCPEPGKASTATEVMENAARSTAELSRKVPALLRIYKANEQLKSEINKMSATTTTKKLREMRSTVLRMHSDVELIQDGKQIRDINMQVAITDFITNFLNDPTTMGYKKSLDCVTNIKGEFEKVVFFASVLVEFRNAKADSKMFDDLKLSSIVISESSSSLKSIREMFGTIKAKNSTDTIKKLAKYSKPFGEAVNALVSADVALSETKEFQSLIKQGRLIETTVEALNEDLVDKNFWKEWGDFGETVYQILTMTSKVNEWENEIEVFNGTTLDELAAVFPKFPELNDVEINFMDRLSALKLVKPMWTPNINELRDDFIKSLKPVLKLDLQFSRFKSAVAGMPETIKQVSRVLNGVNEDSVVFGPPVKPDKPVDTESSLLVKPIFLTIMRIWTGISVILVALCTKLALSFPIEFPELAFVKSVSQNEHAKQAIEKLAKTARVVSAVTLLHGLSDGSISIDNVISELMNLGTIDLKSLENFDKSKVDAFMEKLKTVNLKDTSKGIEEGLKDLYTIQQKWMTVGNLNGLPDDNTYKKLYALKKVDVSSLKNLPIDDILALLGKPTLSEADVASLKSSLTDISTKFDSIKTNVNLEEMAKILESLKPLYIISDVFGLIDTVPSMDKSRIGQATADSLLANFNLLDGLTSDADSTMFDAVGKVISSRFVFHPTNREYSSGFLHGFNDLNKLADDSKDEWVQKLFGSSVKLDEITSLVDLQTPMMEIDKKWSTHATPDVYNSIRRAMNIRQSLLATTKKESKKDVEDTLAAAHKCTGFKTDPTMNENIKNAAKGSAELSRKIPALLNIQKSNAQLKAEVIGKLSTSIESGDLQTIRSAMLKLQSDLKSVLDGRPFKDIEMEIPFPELITKISTNGHSKLYKQASDCVIQLKGAFKNVALSSQAIVEIRDIKANSKAFDDVKTSAAVVSESSASFKSIRDIFGTIKKESKSSDAAKKLMQYSKSFGEGVNALVSADVALRKTTEFQSMISKGRLIEDAVESSNNIVIEEKFWKDWGDIGKTAHQISTLLNRIMEWQNEIKESTDASLDGLSAVFSKVPDLNDVDLQAENKLTAVYSNNLVLVPNIKKLRDDFIKDLTPISKLDLQFSRFKSAVDAMPETMKQVSGVLNGGNITSTETSTEAAGLSVTEWILVVGGIILGLGSIVVTILCCLNSCGIRTWASNLCKKKKQTGRTGGTGGKSGTKNQKSGSKNKAGKTNTSTTTTASTTAATRGTGTDQPEAPPTPRVEPSGALGTNGGAPLPNAGGAPLPNAGGAPLPNAGGASETNGGAGGSGGGQQVQQVQQGAAPLQNAVQNGASNNVNAQQPNNQAAGGGRGSSQGNSSSGDNTDMYINDRRWPEGDIRRLIPTYPDELGINDCTGFTGNGTLQDLTGEFSEKGPKKN
ncbi:hypothetical protein CAEBREN_19785 [Caenorhabditis brenneri]|uniref:Domain of unknown function WSN domain-containing protein n=1 Tax=Caenorhabditis brenneri TaxID=135651 RepID=G0N845_CAEBE|nr:hypothetical protein CAEBREN_19785 [Caenorhabditis brenneri]